MPRGRLKTLTPDERKAFAALGAAGRAKKITPAERTRLVTIASHARWKGHVKPAKKSLRAQGYKHLIAASAKGRLTRSRNAISSHVFKLNAQCARVYGCTLLEYLLSHVSDTGSDS